MTRPTTRSQTKSLPRKPNPDTGKKQTKSQKPAPKTGGPPPSKSASSKTKLKNMTAVAEPLEDNPNPAPKKPSVPRTSTKPSKNAPSSAPAKENTSSTGHSTVDGKSAGSPSTDAAKGTSTSPEHTATKGKQTGKRPAPSSSSGPSKKKSKANSDQKAQITNPDGSVDKVALQAQIYESKLGKFLEFWTPASAKKDVPVPRVFRKYESEYNGDGALITEKGYGRLIDIYNQISFRVPELNGMVHIYEDWAGYGMIEVLEKQICDYEMEVKKKNPDVFKLFLIAEALAFVFQADEDGSWLTVDDGDRVEELVKVMGALFLDCIKRLDVHQDPEDYPKALDPPEKGGPLKNIGLVIGTMMGPADQWSGIMCEYDDKVEGWKNEILKIAERRGIKVVWVKKDIVEYENEDEEDEEEAEEERDWDFMKIWKPYKKNNTTIQHGASQFDLHKLSKAQKNKLEGGSFSF